MANKTNRVVTTQGLGTKSILAFTGVPFWSVGIILNDEGVAVDENGKKIIKAGTPIGGTENALRSEQAVLSVISEEDVDDVQGVVLHDVDVTRGDNNGTMLINAYVNEFRMDESIVVSDAVREALDGKVTYVRRNDLR